MPEPMLNDSERHFLRLCPQRLFLLNRARPSPHELGRLRMIERLRQRGLIRGKVDVAASGRDVTVMDVALTNDGRRALGLPVYSDPSDAPPVAPAP